MFKVRVIQCTFDVANNAFECCSSFMCVLNFKKAGERKKRTDLREAY